MKLLSWSPSIPRTNDGVVLRSLQDRSGPLLTSFPQDHHHSSALSLLSGHDEGQGSAWTAKRTRQGWSRRPRESPGQVSKPGKTQLSQDLGGDSLAIDTLPDNRTRVVVSAEPTWRERRAGACLGVRYGGSLGWIGSQRGGGKPAPGWIVGSKQLASARMDEVICSRGHRTGSELRHDLEKRKLKAG